MKKSRRRALCAVFVLLLVALLALPSCRAQARHKGDANGTSATDKKIAQLQARLAEMQEQLATQKRQIVEQEQQIAEQRQQIDEVRSALKADKVSSRTSTEHPAVVTPVQENEGKTQGTDTDDIVEQSAVVANRSLKLGQTFLTPVGFMDLTYVERTSNVGTGIGTNFGAVPLGSSSRGHLFDSAISAGNSRIGLRFDTLVNEKTVLAFYESDFLGNQAGNVLVSTNGFTFRLRLFFGDITSKSGKLELLGGQAWSLMTPGREGISPLPENLFLTQNLDTNYQAGLVWTRTPTFRFVYHPNSKWSLAVAAENAQQYVGGGFSGNSSISLPPSLNGTQLPGQLSDGTTGFLVPNKRPDWIGKIAYDFGGNHHHHVEIAGVARTFAINPSGKTFSTNAGGGSVNSLWVLKTTYRISLIENAFYGRGVGRYLFGQGPDLVVDDNGRPKLVRAGGWIGGLEGKTRDERTTLYTYYGGTYFQRTFADASQNFGYGVAPNPDTTASNNYSNNRTIGEFTAGFQQTLWENPDHGWGKLLLAGQYSYLKRQPWVIAPGDHATSNMFFASFRYMLPGNPPTHGDMEKTQHEAREAQKKRLQAQ